MHRHEFGTLVFDDVRGKPGARHVAGSFLVCRRPQRDAGVLLQARDQARRGKRGDQLEVVGRCRAPIFRHVVIDGRIADAYRPADAGDDLVIGVHHIPQGRDLDVARIPVPAARVLIQGIEGGVVGNAVHGRCHAGD